MSLSTCEKCGGFIPLGPDATNRCQKCGTHVFDMTRDFKCPRCLSLEAALAKAEEALVCATGLIPPIGHTEDALHQVGVLVNEALAAIKETRND